MAAVLAASIRVATYAAAIEQPPSPFLIELLILPSPPASRRGPVIAPTRRQFLLEQRLHLEGVRAPHRAPIHGAHRRLTNAIGRKDGHLDWLGVDLETHPGKGAHLLGVEPHTLLGDLVRNTLIEQLQG